MGAELGNDGLARNRRLADRNLRDRAGRQVDVDPRAETNETDALADGDVGFLVTLT